MLVLPLMPSLNITPLDLDRKYSRLWKLSNAKGYAFDLLEFRPSSGFEISPIPLSSLSCCAVLDCLSVVEVGLARLQIPEKNVVFCASRRLVPPTKKKGQALKRAGLGWHRPHNGIPPARAATAGSSPNEPVPGVLLHQANQVPVRSRPPFPSELWDPLDGNYCLAQAAARKVPKRENPLTFETRPELHPPGPLFPTLIITTHPIPATLPPLHSPSPSLPLPPTAFWNRAE